VPLDPARVLDTRTNASPVLGGTTRDVPVDAEEAALPAR